MRTRSGRKPIPTDPETLQALLRGLTWEGRGRVRARLVAQLSDPDEAARLFEEAEVAVLREAKRTRLRAELHETFTAALALLARSGQVLEELMGDEVRDAAYVDGGRGARMVPALETAVGTIREVARLNPCPVDIAAGHRGETGEG